MSAHVLRVPRSDSSDFVLLHVKSGAEHELDLEAEATEGAFPYVASFKHHKIVRALAKQSKYSDEEWETILQCLMLQHTSSNDTKADLIQNLELNAHIADGRLVLVFRRNIEEIHQRVAELVLPRDEDHEIDVMAWASTAVQRADSLEAELQAFRCTLQQGEKDREKLRQQLDELVQAKIDHEQVLLEKFSRLLNTKKMKIRNQQRLLNEQAHSSSTLSGSKSSTKADLYPATGKAIEKDGPTRHRNEKRKRGEAQAESSDIDQEMVDVSGNESTGSRRSEAESSEDEDLDDVRRVSKSGNSSKQKTTSKGAEVEQITRSNRISEEPEAPPPVRSLPFKRKKKPDAAAAADTASSSVSNKEAEENNNKEKSSKHENNDENNDEDKGGDEDDEEEEEEEEEDDDDDDDEL